MRGVIHDLYSSFTRGNKNILAFLSVRFHIVESYCTYKQCLILDTQLISDVNLRIFSLPPSGVVDGWLLQRQTCVGVQNYGGFHKGAELRAASVTPPLGRNRPCSLQWVSLLQQTPEQHPGRITNWSRSNRSKNSEMTAKNAFLHPSRFSIISALAVCCSSAA